MYVVRIWDFTLHKQLQTVNSNFPGQRGANLQPVDVFQELNQQSHPGEKQVDSLPDPIAENGT